MMTLLQVAALITLVGGQASTPVRNASSETVAVTVALHYGTVEAGQVLLGREVAALAPMIGIKRCAALTPGRQWSPRSLLSPRPALAPARAPRRECGRTADASS